MAQRAKIPRWRRWLRRAVWGSLAGLLLLALLLAGALYSLRWPAVQDRVLPLVLEQVHPILPGVKLGSLRGSVVGSLVLTRVELRDRFGGEAISAERVELEYDLWALLRREVRVERARLVGPRVLLRRVRGGDLNLAALVVPSADEPEEPSSPLELRVVVEQLELARGGVSVGKEVGGPVTVKGLSLAGAGRLKLGPAGLSAAVQRLQLGAMEVILADGQALSLDLRGDAGVTEQRVHGQLKLTSLTHGWPGAQGGAPRRAVSLLLKAAGSLAAPLVELDLRLPGEGRVQARATAALPGWKLGKYRADLTMKGVNPAALWPAMPAGRLGLKLTASGQGVPLQAGSRAKARLTSAGARLLGYRLDSLALSAGLAGDRWTLGSLRAAGHGATLGGKARGDLKGITTSDLRLEAPSLASLPVPRGTPPLAGHVKLAATVKGAFAGPLAATARLQAGALAVDRVKLRELKLDARVGGLPAKPSGTVALSLAGLDPGSPELRIHEASLSASGGRSDLKLEVVARGPEFKADLGAGLSLAGEQLSVSLGRLDLAFKGQRLVLGNRPGIRAKLKEGLSLGPTRLAMFGGTVDLQGEVKRSGQPRLELKVRARRLRPLVDRPAIDLDLAARLGRQALEARATVDAGLRVALKARLPVRHGKGPVPSLAMAGALSLELDAPALDLAALGRWAPGLPPLAGEAALTFRAGGTLRQPRGRLDLTLQRAAVGQVKGLSGEVTLELQPGSSVARASLARSGAPLLALDVSAGVGPGELLAGRRRLLRLLEAVPLRGSVALTLPSLALAGALLPDLEGRLEGEGSARLALSGAVLRPEAKLTVEGAGLKLDGSPLPDLGGRVILAAGEGTTRAEVRLSAGGAPLLSGEGKFEAPLGRLAGGTRALGEAAYEASAEVEEADLGRLLGGHPRLGKLRGRLSLSAEVLGRAGRLPRADVKLSLGKGGLGRAEVGDLKLEAKHARNGQVSGSLDLKQRGKKVLWALLEASLRQGPITLPLGAKDLDIAFLSALSPSLREVAGKLSMDLKVAGKLPRVGVTGTVSLDGGKLKLSGVGPLNKIKARIGLRPDRLEIKELAWSSGGGTLSACGQAALDGLRPGKFELHARTSKYDLGVAPVQGSELTTAAKVKGALAGDTLTADVKLDQSTLKLAKIGGGQDLHRAGALPEVYFVDDPKVRRKLAGGPGSAPVDPPAVKLRVSASVDPLFVRGADLDVEATADVQARSDHRGRIRLTGEAGLRRGWIKVLDNQYRVKRAVVQFGGEAVPDPALDVLLYREFSSVTVNIAVGGTARKPELELTSQPAVYTRSQILAMILTGKPQLTQQDDQAADPASAVAAAVVSTVLGPITRQVASTVGLDVARVSLEEQKAKGEEDEGAVNLKAQAELGKYLTDRLYIGYRKVFGGDEDENSHEALLEYSISARWLLMALFGDAGVGGLDLFWTYRY